MRQSAKRRGANDMHCRLDARNGGCEPIDRRGALRMTKNARTPRRLDACDAPTQA
jgi:hypothetical protein